MGQTVIKAFRDVKIWIGSVTVLPGEQGISGNLKVGFQRLKLMKGISRDEKSEDEETETDMSKATVRDRLAKHIEEGELAEAEMASEHGDDVERDIHFYHYILAKELRHVMRDVDASPPKQYTYQEWSHYLRLIGQNEDDPSGHRKPKIHNQQTSHGSDLGMANEGGDDAWSWLGVRSPLMGSRSEAEWLLNSLSVALEREMLMMRDSRAKRRPPPMSVMDMRNSRRNPGADPGQDSNDDIGAAEVRRRGKQTV